MLELWLLTLINLFNYLDRYIMVALSPTIKKELSLSDTQVGFLTTAFMLTYFLASPLFGWLGDRKPRYRLMSLGVALWSVATVGSGLAHRFSSLLGTRFFVGIGEAAYGTISPAVLSDLFPKEKRGRIFAIFFMALPVGSALGYLLGGLLEQLVGWRLAFIVAGVPGLALAAALLFLKEPKRGAFEDEEDRAAKAQPLLEVYKSFARNSNYVLTVLGYCAYTFVLGGVAVWIPHYLERYLGMQAAEGNMLFGGITVVAGFIGTLVGGAWADRWAKRSGDAYLKLSAISMIVALPVFFLLLQVKSLWAFSVLCFVLEFLLFLSTSPINAQIVACVPVLMRASASAVAIFMIHLLGDAISPPLVGFISDKTNLLVGMHIFLPGLLLAGLIWGSKCVLFWETLPWPSNAFVLPKLQVHRGLHGTHSGKGLQENTLEAFRAAKGAGAPMVEMDLRLSKDGQVVVIHDASIERVSGKKGFVAELSAAELKQLANVPTLREVLLDKEIPTLLNLELKSDSAASNGLEQAVVATLQETKTENRVMFSSFNPLVLRRLSKLLPEVPRALLASADASDSKNKIYLRKLWLATLARPHMVNLDAPLFGPEQATSFAARGIKVALWTLNSPQEAKNLLARGAVSIISDNPKLLE